MNKIHKITWCIYCIVVQLTGGLSSKCIGHIDHSLLADNIHQKGVMSERHAKSLQYLVIGAARNNNFFYHILYCYFSKCIVPMGPDYKQPPLAIGYSICVRGVSAQICPPSWIFKIVDVRSSLWSDFASLNKMSHKSDSYCRVVITARMQSWI